MTTRNNYVCQKNTAAKVSAKNMLRTMNQLTKMRVVVVGYYHSDICGRAVIEALHTNATQLLVDKKSAHQTSHGIDETGKYQVWGMLINDVYIRWKVRP